MTTIAISIALAAFVFCIFIMWVQSDDKSGQKLQNEEFLRALRKLHDELFVPHSVEEVSKIAELKRYHEALEKNVIVKTNEIEKSLSAKIEHLNQVSIQRDHSHQSMRNEFGELRALVSKLKEGVDACRKDIYNFEHNARKLEDAAPSLNLCASRPVEDSKPITVLEREIARKRIHHINLMRSNLETIINDLSEVDTLTVDRLQHLVTTSKNILKEVNK